MRICLVQLDVSLAEPMAERIARAAALVRGCAGANLVVLPELWAHGAWAADRWGLTAEGLDGPVVTALRSAARVAGVHLHAGSIVERDGDLMYNTAVLIGSDGEVAARYRKIHRFGFDAGEAVTVAPGTELVTWAVPVADGSTAPGRGSVESPALSTVTLGLATCYDLRFPEQFRALLDAGVQAFVVSASWPARRAEHWRLLARARAVENLSFVLAAGACGTQLGVAQAGGSLVVDPWGEVLAEAGTTETVLDVEIDPTRVAEVRKEFPALRDRRL
jgi:predicted amidohydrolase